MVESLPSTYKYGQGRTKRLLQQAASGRLPASILGRAKKGFGIPVARWLRGPLAPLLDRLLGSSGWRGRESSARRRSIAASPNTEQGVRDHRKPLWTLLMFQLWHETWLE